jgi:hypothetical protein
MDTKDFVDVMTELMIDELDYEFGVELGLDVEELERKAELLWLKVALSF